MFHIIMCTYNAQQFLREQLQSIADSTVKDFVIHIFDDESTDETLSEVGRFQVEHPDSKIDVRVNEHNLGPWKNFLVGVQKVGKQLSVGEYIMLSDQDDIWKPDKISVTYEAMKELEDQYGKDEPLLVSTDVILVDENKKIISESYVARNNFDTSHNDLPHALMENHVQGCTIMLNKALADLVTEIPETATVHDTWLSLVAISMGHVAYLNKQTMFYRDLHTSVTGHNKSYKEDMKVKLSTLDKQRKILLTPIPMYKEFIRIYGDKLPIDARKVFDAYIGLETNGFFKKRFDIIRFGMWKTGCIRNIGLMVLA